MPPDRDQWGIAGGYLDLDGRWHEPAPEAVEAMLAAMGADLDADGGPPDAPRQWFTRPGAGGQVLGPADLVLEDGTDLGRTDDLPVDLPLGYHELRPHDGSESTLLVVSPGTCPTPVGRPWGLAVQLYATRSAASWGIGDLGDLRAIARWARSAGAGMVALNPLHAHGPGFPQEPSPYFPSSRRFLDPLNLRVEDVDGADHPSVATTLASAVEAGRALTARPTIDRDQVWRLKRAVLEACFLAVRQRGGPPPSAPTVLGTEGGGVRSFALWCAIADRHGDDWRRWPASLRDPDGAGVRAFAVAEADRVAFHLWLQQQLDRQHAAAVELPLLADLAVGFNPGGADAWEWQHLLAGDARVGAPPDEFNHLGQDWGLPPFVPHRLRASGYAPFVDTLRAAFRHAAGLRIDHVMGLFRLWWVAPGAPTPASGGYVRYPSSDLLDLLALEAHRAGAFVVGEDLGLVEDSVRAELAARRVLSTRLAWFEDQPPSAWPEGSVASLGTHDLATLSGVWSGTDALRRRSLGLPVDDAAEERVRGRLARLVGRDGATPLEEVTVEAHRHLADAGSSVVLAALADVVGADQRVNVPGTTTEWPNWSVALPLGVEQLPGDPVASAVAEALTAGRTPPPR